MALDRGGLGTSRWYVTNGSYLDGRFSGRCILAEVPNYTQGNPPPKSHSYTMPSAFKAQPFTRGTTKSGLGGYLHMRYMLEG
ncbi:hypothetical protein ACLMJK_006604 [Lecanora helva]